MEIRKKQLWKLIFAIFTEQFAGIHVFLIFGEIVACGGIEASGEEIGVGFAQGDYEDETIKH